MLSLFKAFPQLAEKLSHIKIGIFPTPVEYLRNISDKTGKSIFIKRDDLSAIPYGGNKVRKLEFLLGDAKQCGAQRVITSGGAGSNHALATAIYASAAGFKTTLMLFEQPNEQSVRDNLLADLWSGAEMYLDDKYEIHKRSLERVIQKYKEEERNAPYLIPAGGSSPIGTIGFVNAGFELAEQIRLNGLPVFSDIYVTLGTMGTVAGLLLGIRAAGLLGCRIHAVRVVPAAVANKRAFGKLFRSTNELLHKNDPSFPLITINSKDVLFDDNHFGEGYGIYSAEAKEACRLLLDTEGIHLDGTYTGKTFSAVLTDKTDVKEILFWDTKNSRSLKNLIEKSDYRRLPPAFHHYFT